MTDGMKIAMSSKYGKLGNKSFTFDEAQRKAVQSMKPSPGPEGTIVEMPKRSSFYIGPRRLIVVSVKYDIALLKPWTRPALGWRKHVRKMKAKKRKL